jgi:hypothetical protein
LAILDGLHGLLSCSGFVKFNSFRNELNCGRATMVESKIGSLSDRELLNELAP